MESKLSRQIAAIAFLAALVHGSEAWAHSPPAYTDAAKEADEVAALKKRALAGDNTAAVTLHFHYGHLHNDREARYWRELAGRRGDCNEIGVISERYIFSGARKEADYWMRINKRYKCPSYSEDMRFYRDQFLSRTKR